MTTAIFAGLCDSISEYGTPLVFSVMYHEEIEPTELLRPIE